MNVPPKDGAKIIVIDWNLISRSRAIFMLQLAYQGLLEKDYQDMTVVEAVLYNQLTRYKEE